jgi:cobalamin biosynthesis Mg chelatase CobN
VIAYPASAELTTTVDITAYSEAGDRWTASLSLRPGDVETLSPPPLDFYVVTARQDGQVPLTVTKVDQPCPPETPLPVPLSPGPPTSGSGASGPGHSTGGTNPAGTAGGSPTAAAAPTASGSAGPTSTVAAGVEYQPVLRNAASVSASSDSGRLPIIAAVTAAIVVVASLVVWRYRRRQRG